MSLADIILTIVIICAFAAAVIITVRNKKRGKGCSCGCENCGNPVCSSNKVKADKKNASHETKQ